MDGEAVSCVSKVSKQGEHDQGDSIPGEPSSVKRCISVLDVLTIGIQVPAGPEPVGSDVEEDPCRDAGPDGTAPRPVAARP
jgi:hypothetical protein